MKFLAAATLALTIGLLARAQQAGPPPPPPDSALHSTPPGKWWKNPEIVRHVGITAEQQRKIDDLFQQNRLHLIDLMAALEKENAILDPLVEDDHPDEAKLLAQIDRVAQARAELEKANARFVLGIRRVLTLEQWHKMQAERPAGPPPPMRQPQQQRGGK